MHITSKNIFHYCSKDEVIHEPKAKGGPFKPFTQFPTPNLLALSQREYAAEKKKPEVDQETGVPVPSPPPTTKSQVFDPEKYSNTDKRALSVS